MIGQGVLRECERASDVSMVLLVGRRSQVTTAGKVRDLVVPDLMQLSQQGEALKGYDACFYSAGVSAVGLTEAEYSRVTYDLTLSVAHAVLASNPGITFIYVYVQGTR